MAEMIPYDPAVLPAGVRSRFVAGINGLTVHILEAGFETKGRPCLLLLHGFPELAYSWRKVMGPLAAAGYHVVAPDLRGYGRTTGWDADYDADQTPFRLLNAVRDSLGLVAALGYRGVAAVIGHDFGSPVAAWCALVRPDVFRSLVMMSAPFAGPPPLPFDTDANPARKRTGPSIHDDLAALERPRKHYHWYYSTRPANADMCRAPQGLHAVLRAYYHHKSADWKANTPHRLEGWIATELAKLPTYYIMELNQNMAETVAPHMPSAAEIAACTWLTDAELGVYSAEFARTSLQGGLNWYRSRTGGRFDSELKVYSCRTIDVPSMFISGTSDWGTYQRPHDFERMQTQACTDMRGVHLLDGAGHWVQQEQPGAVVKLLLEFMAKR